MAENRTKVVDINDPSMRTGELSEDEVARIAGGQRKLETVQSPPRTQTTIDTIHGNNTRTDDLIDSE